MTLTIGSLFSGIGGLELGLEWAGLGPVVWQVEMDDYCRRVLAKHWPDATRYEDVRHVGVANLAPVDLICGGFPCQDVSDAGRRAGIAGARSGLWIEYARIIGEMGPRYVVVENVPGLLARGMGRVLGDLAALGYDAEWDCIPACAIGAPHIRDRLFIIGSRAATPLDWTGREWRILADTESDGLNGTPHFAHGQTERDVITESERSGCEVADAHRERRSRWRDAVERNAAFTDERSTRKGEASDPEGERCGQGRKRGSASGSQGQSSTRHHVPDSQGERDVRRGGQPANDRSDGPAGRRAYSDDVRAWWSVEPDVGRVAHGVPARVDRLRALGNAVVPQVAEIVGHVILARENEKRGAA